MSTTYIRLGDSVRFEIGTTDSMAQAVNADATPTITVLDQGSVMAYAPTVTNIAAGLYEAVLALTSGNLFTAGHECAAYVTYAVSGVTKREPLCSFKLTTRNIDDAAYPATSGRSLAVDVSGNVTAASVAGNVAGSVASVTGSVGSVTGNVGGNVVGSVGSVTANGIGSGAISAAELTAIASAIWGATAEGANTYANIVRLIAGVLAGTVADFTGSTLTFKSLDGTKTRLTVTVGSTGRTAIVVGDLT